jgi:hypothetical protein
MNGGSDVITNMNNGAQYFYETWRIAEGNSQAIVPPAPNSPAAQGPLPYCPGTQQVNTLSGPVFGNLPPCLCMVSDLGGVPPSATGTCSSSASTGSGSSGNTSNGGAHCPANCKYGCSLITGICNVEIYQSHTNP